MRRLNIKKYAEKNNLPYCLVDTIRQTAIENSYNLLRNEMQFDHETSKQVIINYAIQVIKEILE